VEVGIIGIKENELLAERIIEEYHFGRELTAIEKRALKDAILDHSYWFNGYQLTHLIEKFDAVGFSKQDTYGAIITIGVYKGMTGYGLNNFFGCADSKGIISSAMVFKKKGVDEITILKALSEYLTLDEEAEVRQQLLDLGVNPYFFRERQFNNIYIAKTIVDRHEWERNLENEEKRFLIERILDNEYLAKGKRNKLSVLISRLMQIGLTEQEIYRLLINYAISRIRTFGKKEVSYTKLVSNKCNAIEKIGETKDEIKPTVDTVELMIMVSENLTDEEKNRVRKYIEGLGIRLCGNENLSLLYIIQRIIESYNFEVKLEVEEKKFLVEKILSRKRIKKDLLSDFMRKLSGVGLSEQEIYGTIINLVIDGKIAEGKEYEYPKVLARANKVWETGKVDREMINTDVNTMQIILQKSETLTDIEIESLKQQLENIGVNPEIIQNKSPESLYLAKRIIEIFDSRRILNPKEKSALIHAILNGASFKEEFSEFFLKTITGLQLTGLMPKQICATIINFAVNRCAAVGEKKYKYQELTQMETCRVIGENIDEVAVVTDETIRKAVEDGGEILREAVRVCAKGDSIRPGCI